MIPGSLKTVDTFELARRVVRDFLKKSTSSTPFWSVRHISRRYRCTEYTGHSVLRVLRDWGYLEILPNRRSMLRPDVNLALLGMTQCPAKPAVILPWWEGDQETNFCMAFTREIVALCKAAGSKAEVYHDRQYTWGDPHLVHRLKASSVNSVIAVCPPADSLILFTKLCESNLPILVQGTVRPGYDALNIPTIDGDEKRAVFELMTQLRADGVKAPLFVGYGENVFCHEQRVRGLKEVYGEDLDVEAEGYFTNVGDRASQIQELAMRVAGNNPPDAIIFNGSPFMEAALERIPDLAARIRKKLFRVAVFDDTGLRERLADLPVTAIVMHAAPMAQEAMGLVENLREQLEIPSRTLLPREIIWDRR